MFKVISGLLVVLGLVVIGFALTMDVTVDVPGQYNKRVFNLHLASQQTNTLIVGGLLFISGILMLVASHRRGGQHEDNIGRGSPQVGPVSIALEKWRTKPTETKLILVGSVLAILSTLFNWTNHYLTSLHVGGDRIGLVSLVILLGCWSFPLYSKIKGIRVTRKQLAIPATILVLWMLMQKLSTNDIDFVSVSIGLGMWMASISGWLLAWAAYIHRDDI